MLNKAPDQANILREYAGTMIRETSKVHSNLGQQIVITTEDKIRICLMIHLARMEKHRGWTTPLGIFLTLLVVFPTTTFQSWLNIPAETWQAVLILSCVLSFIWLCISAWGARTKPSIDNVIFELKKSSLTETEGNGAN